ncbi:MAG: ABC transporter permease, partial [Propionibacteriaceae bacterium]|nr:ABC transporter permease [Propionibacteriaceae bacterium]
MRILLRRLAFYIITAWAAISLNFVLPRIMPGDPVTNMVERFRGRLTPQAIQALRVLFGQEHSNLWLQYVDYWKNLFHGNFGISYAYYPTPVTTVVNGAIWWTLIPISLCTILAFVIGVSLGTVVGWKRGTWLDALVPVTSFISSIPYFWFAIIMALIFS